MSIKRTRFVFNSNAWLSDPGTRDNIDNIGVADYCDNVDMMTHL